MEVILNNEKHLHLAESVSVPEGWAKVKEVLKRMKVMDSIEFIGPSSRETAVLDPFSNQDRKVFNHNMKRRFKYHSGALARPHEVAANNKICLRVNNRPVLQVPPFKKGWKTLKAFAANTNKKDKLVIESPKGGRSEDLSPCRCGKHRNYLKSVFTEHMTS